MKSIEWVCEYRDCSNTFKRFPYQIKENTKKYCCQSHATQEQIAKERETNNYSTKKIPVYICSWCKVETTNYSKSCNECRRILSSVRDIGLENFTPNDYYRLFELQEGRCAICSTDKCRTGKRLAIDHDHTTGKVRGLLCYSCNHKLGWYENKRKGVDSYLGTQ